MSGNWQRMWLDRFDPRARMRTTEQELDYPNQGELYDDLLYPGHGYPKSERMVTALAGQTAATSWGRMSQSGGLGKKANLLFNNDNHGAQSTTVPILQVGTGSDADAQQVVITLSSPLVIALPFSQLLFQNNLQNITGEQDNIEAADRTTFPGTEGPLEWPPIEAIVEWGVGGGSSRAVIDFVNGATIRVSASWIRVHARVAPNVSVPVFGTSAIYVLSAFVAPGQPGICSSQNTIRVGSIASLAESDLFPVPRFARSAQVVSFSGAGAPEVTVATLRFWQTTTPDVSAGNFICTGNQPLPFDVPNGAQYASVINGMSGSNEFAIVYTLSI